MQQYSPKNQIFLTAQAAERGFTISDVRSCKAWNAAGRSIRKGEKALRVWIPKRGKAIPDDLSTMTDAQERECFVRGPVFDISQTKEMAPRHRKSQNSALSEYREEQAWTDYAAAIEAGDIPADLDFANWYELREDSIRVAAGCSSTVGAIDFFDDAPADYIIAQVEHHDFYPPIGGGSQELDDIDTGAATAAPDSVHAARVTFYSREGWNLQDVNLRTTDDAADWFHTLNASGATDLPDAWYAATLQHFDHLQPVIIDTVHNRLDGDNASPADQGAVLSAPEFFATTGVSAYRWSSFDPENRAERDRMEFEQDVATLLEQYTPIATTDEQRALLDTELERYMQNYLKHYAGIYAARGRTASTMITGASNFNTRRNQKYLDLEHRRVTEFLDWREKAQTAVERALLDARTDEQKSAAMTSRLIKWAGSELDTLEKIARAEQGDPSVPSWYAAMNKSAFVTSFTGKLHREVKNGHLAEVQGCLRWLDEQQQATGRQLITKRNSVWTYLDQQPAAPATAEESRVIYAANGVTVTANHELGRYQIQHDEKPDAAIRSELKRHGWRWSPQYTAWQRHLNNATLSNLTKLFPDLNAA